MGKHLKIVPYGQYKMTEQDIIRHKMMGVLFGSHSYDRSIAYIGKIREEIAHEFPSINDDEISVHEIRRTNGTCGAFASDRFANHVMLWCQIPTEDYLRLKRNGEIGCL